jgi:hypothetical protein
MPKTTKRSKKPVPARHWPGNLIKTVTIGLLISLPLLFGCASMQVKDSGIFDWDGISTVSLNQPDSDPWALVPIIENELKAMGLNTDPGRTPDLLLSFETREGRDLDADSEIVTRLKSLHIYLADPAKSTRIAAIDYFYPPTGEIDPATGVEESFSAIRQLLENRKTAPSAGKPKSHADSATATEPTPEPSTAAPVSRSDELRPPATNASGETTQAAPHEDRQTSAEQQPAPVSPWSLKLRSWGFETWGKETDKDSAY